MTFTHPKEAAAVCGARCGFDSGNKQDFDTNSRGVIHLELAELPGSTRRKAECKSFEGNHTDRKTRSDVKGSEGDAYAIQNHILIKDSTWISTHLFVCCCLALVLGMLGTFPVYAHPRDLDRHPQSNEPDNQDHRPISSRRGSTQVTRAPKSLRQGDGSDQYEGDDAIASIDRFDLGEQIRAPLLKSPTTLAPLKSANGVARRSDPTYRSDEYDNQDQNDPQSPTLDSSSQLTPDERDQLMRSQEAHYEGGGSGGGGGGGDLGGPTSANDEQELPQQAASHRGRLQQSLPIANNNEAAPSNQDDDDYQDEGSDNDSVPQNRLGPLSRSATRTDPKGAQSQSVISDERRNDARDRAYGPRSVSNGRRPDGASQIDADNDANDQTNPDDYSTANEDMYFSRKPSSNRVSSPTTSDQMPLNLAASNNRQQNEILARRTQNRPEEGGDPQEGLPDISGVRPRPSADASEPEDEAEDDGGGEPQQGRSRPWQQSEPRS